MIHALPSTHYDLIRLLTRTCSACGFCLTSARGLGRRQVVEQIRDASRQFPDVAERKTPPRY